MISKLSGNCLPRTFLRVARVFELAPPLHLVAGRQIDCLNRGSTHLGMDLSGGKARRDVGSDRDGQNPVAPVDQRVQGLVFKPVHHLFDGHETLRLIRIDDLIDD